VTIHDLAHRIKVGLGRKQVGIGKDRMVSLLARNDVGLVLATSDLSRNAYTKLRLKCERAEVPLMRTGSSEEIGEITGYTNTRLYLLRRNFAGLKQLVADLSEQAESGE
jgi:ribosomal protein L7Ae-like RNA K-turn-binding protein